MTLKPKYRRIVDKETMETRLTVTLTLSAHDMEDLLANAAIGYNCIADRCPLEGFPAQEAHWRKRAIEASEAVMLIGQAIDTFNMDQKANRDAPLSEE
jgi:hypothetical protein